MPAVPVFDDTLGAIYIGIVMAGILYGVGCVQAFYYFAQQNDRWPLKATVAAVLLFDTVHQALISHFGYVYIIKNFANPVALGNLEWSLIIEVLFNGLTALLVQGFMTWRVWHVSGRSILLTTLVSLFVLAEFVFIVIYTGYAMTFKTFAELTQLQHFSVTVNILAAAGDVSITAILCWFLHKSRSSFQRSNIMIDKLIIFAVNTGFLTSLCAVASMISFLAAGGTFIYIAFFFCIGRLYTNSILATLNVRQVIRGASAHDYVNSSSDNHAMKKRDRGNTTTATYGTNLSIKIDTTKESVIDADPARAIEKIKSGLTTPTSIGSRENSRDVKFEPV